MEEVKSSRDSSLDSSSNSLSEQKRDLPPTSIDRTLSTKSFSQLILEGKIKVDPKNVVAVANQIIFELNALAGRTLIVYHKLVDIIRAALRFVSEYLQVEFEQKTREHWSESIFRQVSPTSNFALLPSNEHHDIGEEHKNMAK